MLRSLGLFFNNPVAAGTLILVGVVILRVLLAPSSKFGNSCGELSDLCGHLCHFCVFNLSASCMLATMSPLVTDALVIFAM